MTWIAQKTWTTGETVRATDLNVMVRDDLNFLYSPPSARATHPTDQRLDLNNSPFPDFGTTITDTTGTMHGQTDWAAGRPNTSFITTPIAGRYLVGTAISFEPSANDGRAVYIVRSLSSVIYTALSVIPNAGTTNRVVMTLQTIEDCDAGDPLYVLATATSGNQPFEITVQALTTMPSFWAHWLGN